MKSVLCRLPADTGSPRARLLCFTYAGGNGSEYRAWRERLAPAIELALVQMAGRGRRFAEPCVDQVNEVVAEVVDAASALGDLPLALFGHSMGSIVAYETTHALAECGAAAPSHLFVSGRKAAHVPLNRHTYYDLPDRELLDELRRLGSVNHELLDNEELAELMLPVIRADFRLHDDYRFVQREKLAVPITVLGGTEDPSCDPAELSRWGELTTGATESLLFPGGHFFVEHCAAEIAEVVNGKMAPLVSMTGGCRVPEAREVSG